MAAENAWVEASAPASSANLGPGYDCLALALEIRCLVRARRAREWSIRHIGAERPEAGEGDLVLVAARRAVGGTTALEMEVDNAIPIGVGMGSSATAYVAGVAAALRAVDGDASPDRVFRLASELEGHSDNVAASVIGGLVLVTADGHPIRLPLHPSLRPVVAVPTGKLSTHTARMVVSATQPTERVVRSLARVSALTAGLITGDPSFLAEAHGDEIHEAPRAELSPRVVELIATAKASGAFHAARSGAGPAVIAFATESDRVGERLSADDVRVLTPGVATTGLI